jgi:hypothetical protein
MYFMVRRTSRARSGSTSPSTVLDTWPPRRYPGKRECFSQSSIIMQSCHRIPLAFVFMLTTLSSMFTLYMANSAMFRGSYPRFSYDHKHHATISLAPHIIFIHCFHLHLRAFVFNASIRNLPLARLYSSSLMRQLTTPPTPPRTLSTW